MDCNNAYEIAKIVLFQSPMWWGIELNARLSSYPRQDTQVFQSPMWWGIELNCPLSGGQKRGCCRVSIPDVMGNRAESLPNCLLKNASRTFQSPMWWGIELNPRQDTQVSAIPVEFQSPMWWGIELNAHKQKVLKSFISQFQSPMWWGIELNSMCNNEKGSDLFCFNPRCDGE